MENSFRERGFSLVEARTLAFPSHYPANVGGYERITIKSTALTSFDMDYRVRSMQFAAFWLLRSFDSDKLHCVLLVNVM
jgi:hypothetical protein